MREAARRAGLDPSHLIRIETGRTQPTIDTLYRLAEVIGLDDLARALRPLLAEVDDETAVVAQ